MRENRPARRISIPTQHLSLAILSAIPLYFSSYCLLETSSEFRLPNGHHHSTKSACLLWQWSVACNYKVPPNQYINTILTTIKPTDLKNTTDDAIPAHLTTLPQPYTFTQDHTKTNVRFALGYTAVAIAAFTFYADRKLGWEATRSPWIIAAVVSYFVLNSVFTYWVWAVEAGEVFRGRRVSGEMVCPFSFGLVYLFGYTYMHIGVDI